MAEILSEIPNDEPEPERKRKRKHKHKHNQMKIYAQQFAERIKYQMNCSLFYGFAETNIICVNVATCDCYDCYDVTSNGFLASAS